MTSFKSKIFNFLLKNRHLFQGKLKKESFDLNTSILKFREQCEKGATRYAKIPKGITIKPEIISGINAEWIIPEGTDGKKVILYVHGGDLSLAQLAGLPPIFINSGADDELFEDGEKFYLKARETGVNITFRAGIGMVHCYPLLAPMFKEATLAMDEICVFIKKHLS